LWTDCSFGATLVEPCDSSSTCPPIISGLAGAERESSTSGRATRVTADLTGSYFGRGFRGDPVA
jgi:hypothetical protein